MTSEQYARFVLDYLALGDGDDYTRRFLAHYFENCIPIMFAIRNLECALLLNVRQIGANHGG